jgi:hypothetical protein
MTSVGSLRLLSGHPEIVAWFQAIEAAAGINASADLVVRKRNKEPDQVVVRIETSACTPPAWFDNIEAAAGENAAVDLTIRRRNGQPDSVIVQCSLRPNGEKE